MKVKVYYGYGLNDKNIDVWDGQILRLTKLLLQWDWGEIIGAWDEVYVFFDHKGYHLVAVEYLDTLRFHAYHRYYECSDCNEYRNRVGRYLRMLLAPYEKVLYSLMDYYLEREVRKVREENDE
jgi:hypothetical protein